MNSKCPDDTLRRAPSGEVTVWLKSARPLLASAVKSRSACSASPAAADSAASASAAAATRRRAALLVTPRHQQLAVAVGRHRRHQPRLLHLLEQPRGAVVADAQVALHERDRRLAVLEHDRDRLVVHRVGLAVAAGRAVAVRALGVRVERAALEDAFDVVRLALRLQVLDDAMDLVVADESAVQ